MFASRGLIESNEKITLFPKESADATGDFTLDCCFSWCYFCRRCILPVNQHGNGRSKSEVKIPPWSDPRRQADFHQISADFTHNNGAFEKKILATPSHHPNFRWAFHEINDPAGRKTSTLEPNETWGWRARSGRHSLSEKSGMVRRSIEQRSDSWPLWNCGGWIRVNYPLVNEHSCWKAPPSVNKSTINGPFSSSQTVKFS